MEAGRQMTARGQDISVLVVDDDPGIRTSLRLALEDEHYTVFEAGTGEHALDLVRDEPPDVVLLDLMLPGMDGFECCRQIRETSEVPVIVVSARSDVADVVDGLEAGADDYVTKPFAVRELFARLRALRRRTDDAATGTVRKRIGDLEISPSEGTTTLNGDPVHLTKTEFRLLCALAEFPGRVFGREELLRDVWDYDFFGDTRIVDVHIGRLRRKLEHDAGNPRYVVTVRGLGYKLQP
jgi:DNA-binding response OmpR family regulator